MKRLLLLLCALLLVSLVSSSDLFAASKSREYRIPNIFAVFWQNCFPLSPWFFVPDDAQPIIGDDPGSKVGGDADDYANGKTIPGPYDKRPEGSGLFGRISTTRGGDGSILGRAL